MFGLRQHPTLFFKAACALLPDKPYHLQVVAILETLIAAVTIPLEVTQRRHVSIRSVFRPEISGAGLTVVSLPPVTQRIHVLSTSSHVYKGTRAGLALGPFVILIVDVVLQVVKVIEIFDAGPAFKAHLVSIVTEAARWLSKLDR